MTIQLFCGDCLEILPTLKAGSIDAIISDPPAGIGFMGKEWDKDKGGRDSWIEWMASVAAECLRVLKPGGHTLIWSLPRTSHWTATAWENAGFEVRDRIAHIFGSGFPKSLDVGKAIDKAAGAKREVVGYKEMSTYPDSDGVAHYKNRAQSEGSQVSTGGRPPITSPATPEAEQWDGWGTGLKPAIEDWWLFRKPISEKTIAANVLKWGTGALNIDMCRVGAEEIKTHGYNGNSFSQSYKEKGIAPQLAEYKTSQGRWPAHLIHDGSQEVMDLFPETKSPKTYTRKSGGHSTENSGMRGVGEDAGKESLNFGDSGSAARFFYCAKPSRREREAGLDGMDLHIPESQGASIVTSIDRQDGRGRVAVNAKLLPRANFHPTVKPLALVRYLITLITPPGGRVLDCFAGSGTTGIAAQELGFDFIGIEKDPGYFEIAQRRING